MTGPERDLIFGVGDTELPDEQAGRGRGVDCAIEIDQRALELRQLECDRAAKPPHGRLSDIGRLRGQHGLRAPCHEPQLR